MPPSAKEPAAGRANPNLLLAYVADLELEVDHLRKQGQLVRNERGQTFCPARGILTCSRRQQRTGEAPMRAANAVLWVVYQMPLPPKHGQSVAVNAVCEQSEWDEMARARPGYFTLIRGGITDEAEAEKLARGTSGDPPIRLPQRT
jgi:hypothetical protein